MHQVVAIGFAKRDGRVYYFNGQTPIFVHNEGDLNSSKMFMAQLFVACNATKSKINKVLGLNPINKTPNEPPEFY